MHSLVQNSSEASQTARQTLVRPTHAVYTIKLLKDNPKVRHKYTSSVVHSLGLEETTTVSFSQSVTLMF